MDDQINEAETKLINKFIRIIVDKEHQMMAQGQILSSTQRSQKVEAEFDVFAKEIDRS